MASRTQMRLAQLTGSFGTALGKISDQRPEQAAIADAGALLMSSGSLLGPLTEMASSIRRIHGGTQFAKAGPGEFHVDILPSANNAKDLGNDGKRFAELHLGTKLRLKGVEITDIKDEDNMASDSAAALATQQSIKAYVDASVTAQDLDFTSDSGNGSVDLDSQALSVLGGEGMNVTHSGQAITVAGEDAAAGSGSANKGVASFEASDFVASSGHVSLVDLTVAHMAAGSITLEGEGIGANDSDTQLPTSAAVKDYVDAQITAQDLDFQADSGGALAIDLDSEVLSILGTANEITTVGSGNAVTISLPDDVTIGRDLAVSRDAVITGNLTVNGAQFKVDGETVVYDDTLIEMGTVDKAAPASGGAITKDVGLLIHQWDGSSASLNFMGFDNSEGHFYLGSGVAENAGVLSNLGTAAALKIGALVSAGQVIGGNVDLNGQLDVSGITALAASGVQTLVRGTLAVDENAEFRGNVTLGNAAGDDIIFNGKIANGALLPRNDAGVDLGAVGSEFKDLFIDGIANIDSLVADTADINGGSIDGAIIGAASAAAGTFTALACDAKALAAAALNINGESAITLDVADEFVVSDAGSANAIKKTTLGAIQTFLAAAGSQKNIVLQGAFLGAGNNVATGITGFGNGNASTREVFVNGQLMYENATGDFEASGDNVDFSFDLEADDVVTFIKRA